ncbi:MAG: DUF4325 domain-containing protein [Bdellovibrio sp.]|nr:DUF4325 domain-containing protein [Bdellovibrio sp.]
MTVVKLNRFGQTLTGREFGKSSYLEIVKEQYELPIALDFSGVASLGSSFADEVVLPLAQKQGNQITILNANNVVRSCLRDVHDETGINIIYDSLD